VRVLNVNDQLDPVTGGGTAERTVQISRALLEAGVECSIMTTNVGLTGKNLPGLDSVRVISYRCLLKRFHIPRTRYADIKKNVESADMIHLMGHWSVLNALVYLAARTTRKPYVVCPAGALPIIGRSRLLKRIYNWIIGQRIIRNACAWVAITADERTQFEPYGIAPNKITVIPNGITPSDFVTSGVDEFRQKHHLAGNPFVLFLGRLNIIKGPDILLEAFCHGQNTWPDWHLVFAGPDGGLLSSLKSRAAESGIRDRVHFIGYVGGAEKSAAYQAADLLVIPSRHEAMSIVVLEAGISGTPVLLTDQCGFDVVERIGGGKVVPATIEGVQVGLVGLLSDRAILAVMGSRLRVHVRDNYTWDVIVRKYLNLYERFHTKA
jgi:glycosyltransferase involved in cell wall biosynthesis